MTFHVCPFDHPLVCLFFLVKSPLPLSRPISTRDYFFFIFKKKDLKLFSNKSKKTLHVIVRNSKHFKDFGHMMSTQLLNLKIYRIIVLISNEIPVFKHFFSVCWRQQWTNVVILRWFIFSWHLKHHVLHSSMVGSFFPTHHIGNTGSTSSSAHGGGNAATWAGTNEGVATNQKKVERQPKLANQRQRRKSTALAER